jgi:hypothetical protein
MSRKLKLTLVTILILVTALLTAAAAGGWESPLAQMDMPTETMQPPSTVSPVTPEMQETPTPEDLGGVQSAASPTWTSIFTGYTPYPDASGTYYPYMGGTGMGGGCGGGGMSGGMGSGGMGMGSGTTINGTPMSGMGGMSGSMDMSSCSMMSGMNMSGDATMLGMDMTGMSGSVVSSSTSVFNNPWLLIGWVLLGVLVVAILIGIGLGIAWLIRYSKQTRPV